MFSPLLMGLALLGVCLVAAACGGSSSSSDVTTMAALHILDDGGLHEIDAAIQQGTIPPTAQTTAAHLQTVALLTPWPKELKSQAVKLAGYLGTLAAVLNADSPDMNQVKDASGYAHAAWHEFSMQAWSYLSDRAGVKN
ncbi:MAG TPA: hypothetical protein VIK11_12930 [Tepidiformaceae bacterium]